MAKRTTASPQIQIPTTFNWKTTDEDEINRRRLRAQSEHYKITNLDPSQPIFSNFQVGSPSGLQYSVEIRNIIERLFACDCVDFRINGLGTCKHVEAVLLHLEARHKTAFKAASQRGSNRLDLIPDPVAGTLRLTHGNGALPRSLRRWFEQDGSLKSQSAEETLSGLEQTGLSRCPELRISQEVAPWLESRRKTEECKALRREYELKVQMGQWPQNETKVPLFPYQREGMLHLAFTERSLLADEMGLGKTIQAIAACALLHRLGKASRALVVSPASLKTEWEEQIQRFTDLPYQVVFGGRVGRLKAYQNTPFFTIVNYEQMLVDALDVNARLNPDIVILDEAQRIKNWNTKTSQAIKRLKSRYAFVLTGTPIENRIDEIHSLMDFLDPSVLGPLFRFNRDFYTLDERGRPAGYRNLDQLHKRIRPFMLRRRKADVESELPDRTDRTHFVALTPEQQSAYDGMETVVARLMHAAKRRALTKQEMDKLQRYMAMMRMTCDTNFILDPEDTACPKLAELEKILEECRENDAKVIVFSEWERMLQLVRSLCQKMDLKFAWHTGSVPQLRRRAEINVFKNDPQCRVFLSTDSGATGLNLQIASVVISCDLPWNPAKLEQRIARAWRKNQTKPVTVINLVSENTIEHAMLGTLANKQALSDGVLDLQGDLSQITITAGRQSFLSRLEQALSKRPASPPAGLKPALLADRSLGFARRAAQEVNGALLHLEERYPAQAPHSVLYVVVERDCQLWRARLQPLHEEFFGPGQSDPLCPVHLEVVDRGTHEALERLAQAGLLNLTTRGGRPLYPEPAPAPAPPPLSPTERAKVEAYRNQAARKVKMARLLGEGGLDEETRGPLMEAAMELARAIALEHRLPEPLALEGALQPPLSEHFKQEAGVLRAFVENPSAPWQPVVAALSTIQQPGPKQARNGQPATQSN